VGAVPKGRSAARAIASHLMLNAAMKIVPAKLAVDQTKTEAAVPLATLAAGLSFAVLAAPPVKRDDYAYLGLGPRQSRHRNQLSHYLGTGQARYYHPPIR
jgi:hypothetical protein